MLVGSPQHPVLETVVMAVVTSVVAFEVSSRARCGAGPSSSPCPSANGAQPARDKPFHPTSSLLHKVAEIWVPLSRHKRFHVVHKASVSAFRKAREGTMRWFEPPLCL